jgi:hypothetical protein
MRVDSSDDLIVSSRSRMCLSNALIHKKKFCGRMVFVQCQRPLLAVQQYRYAEIRLSKYIDPL